MPALQETLALPAPPPGGLKDATPSTLEPEKGEERIEKVKVSVVATQTRSIGMIHPPPDIRSIVDKTATFVARNGPEFEKRILATNKNNVKFNFLIATDPYHAYYRHKVGEFRAQANAPAQATPIIAFPGAPKEKAGGGRGEGTEEQEDRKALQDTLRGGPAKQLEPPEPEQYTVRLPDLLTGLDLDVIKLTAQFVARNGKSFLTGLTSREHMNPQFHFLKPTHSMFTFFTALADAYSKVLMPPKGLADKLRRDAKDHMAVLERCLARLEWEKSQQRARQKAEDEIEAERTQMALIDWHDFVVVETIDFLEEEEATLPQPMSLEEVIRRSKQLADDEELTEEDQAAITQAGAVGGVTDVVKEVEMDMDEEEMQLVEAGMKAANLGEGKAPDRAGAAPPAPPSQDAVDMDQDMEEEEEEAPMRIVRNWKRPEERTAPEVDSTKFVVSPITGELIPVPEMAEHMRISLIDPKYKEQKERMLAKLRENTLAGDEEISRNIVGLAKTRPDIFGTTEEEISNAVTAEIEKKKEDPKHVVWDGHTGSIGRTATQAMHHGMSLEEQIAAIHREKAASVAAEGRTLPGPASLPPPKLATPPTRPLPPPPGLGLNIPRPMNTVSGAIPPLAPPPLPRPTMNLAPPTGRLPSMPPPPPSMMRAPLIPMTRSIPGPSLSSLIGSTTAATLGRPQFGAPPPLPSSFVGMPPRLPLLQPPAPMGVMSVPVPLPAVQLMPPAPPPEDAPPPPPEEPEPKRQKVEEVVLVPEADFLAKHPAAVTIKIAVPLVEGEASLKGQTVELSVPSLGETLGALKERIASAVGLPANKQKLSGRAGFFKDNLTLAYYNVGPGDVVSLGLRERGGRKK